MKALRVGLDVRMALASGIGTYIRNLQEQLGRQRDIQVVPITASASPYSLAEQFKLPGQTLGLQLFHAPHYNAPLVAPVPMVVTIHDLAHLALPSLFPGAARRVYAHAMFRAVTRRARRIIAVSRFTATELQHWLDIPAHRIRVIHNGVSPAFCPDPDPQRSKRAVAELGLAEPFVLAVGNVKPHKNLTGLLAAFQLLEGEPQLAIVGQAQQLLTGDEDFPRSLASSPARQRVHATGRLLFPTLLALYRRARLLVLPSLYEGFGLPVLEAMACGTPVVASDRASLPEVAGDAALLTDPTDPPRLAGVIQRLLDDDDLHAELSARGLARVKQFSWQRSAREHAAVYREIIR